MRIPTPEKTQAVSRSSRPAKATRGVEPLEDRLLWSVALDANGWTVVTPSSDTKTIYVSSSTGNDKNNGLTAATPVFSFKRAEALLDYNKPDWLLLKSGDTFNDTIANWAYSGRSANEPLLVSYYGTAARPIINSGSAYYGFSTYSYAGQSPVNYVDVIGLQFIDSVRDPTSSTFNAATTGGTTGFSWGAPGGNVLVEDCSFRYYVNNFDIEAKEGAITNITIRRTLSADSWSAGTHSQGIFADYIDHLSIIQSVFDHNGWNTLIPGAVEMGYNHDMYISSTCTNVDIEGNVISNASFAGVMARSGGTINNNVFINDAVAVSFGQAGGQYSTIGGVTGSLIGNVVIGDKGLPGLPYGEGFEIGNTRPGIGMLISNNIFTQDTQHAMPAISLTMATGTWNTTETVGENDVTVANNIINGWQTGIQTDANFAAGGSGLYAQDDLKVLNNDIINSTTREVQHNGAFSPTQETWSGDRYYDTALSSANWVQLQSKSMPIATWIANYDLGATVLSSLPYSNANVTAATYDGVLGGPGTVADFITQARALSISNYQPTYMAQALISYIKQGFSITSSPPMATAAVTNLNTTAIGSTTYTFTVNYSDQYLLNTATLGSGNLLVTGPNGFSAMATFVSSATPTTAANGYQQTVATYKITAPGGAWGKGADGTYTINLLAKQVYDLAGYVAAGRVIGTFAVDFTLPTALATATNVVTAPTATSPYIFTVTYSDSSGINIASLNNNQVQVTGPNGYSSFATITGTPAGTTLVTVTYTMPAPNGNWDSTADGTYQISLTGGSVTDLSGNGVAGGILTTFTSQLGSTVVSAANGSISGQVFNDANGNGIMDSRESAMVGVTVFADLAGTGIYATGDPFAVTDSNGNYTLTGLVAGQYAILEANPAGYLTTTPSTGSNILTLSANEVVTSVNFADQLDITSIAGGTTPTPVTTPPSKPIVIYPPVKKITIVLQKLITLLLR